MKRIKLNHLIIAVAALLLLIIYIMLVFFSYKEPATTATIFISGKEPIIIDIQNVANQTIDLSKDYDVNVILEVEDGKIRFLDSDCPDKTCIKRGFLKSESETAACLPNKVAVVMD